MPRRWLKLSVLTLALAAALHLLIVWMTPIVIMQIVMARFTKQAGVNHVLAQPLPTDKSRAVVTPSPDLLYGLCVFDVSDGPIHVSIKPPKTYWSLSLFDTNTDNVFTLNAAALQGDTAAVVIGSAASAAIAKAKFASVPFFEVPHAKGVMLARVLVLDRNEMADALAAQSSVRCDSLNGRS